MSYRVLHLATNRVQHAATFALALLLASAAPAQLPMPRLASLFPAGARAGSTNEITALGSDLDEPQTLAFSDPRITAVPRQDAPQTFRVVVPQNVPPGRLEARFLGRFGASNPRVFTVGDRPELTVPSLPTTASQALPLESDVTVNGRVQPNSVHWFRFAARAGQRWVIRIQARDIDSRLVPDLAVLDSEQRELAVARRSSWLDFTAPTDGTFGLRVSDQTFRGGDDYFFRLTLDSGPWIEFTVPAVLQSGATNPLIVFGRNLPGSRPSNVLAGDGRPLEQLTLQLPAPASADRSGPPPLLPRRPAATLLDTDWLSLPLEIGNRTLPWVLPSISRPVHNLLTPAPSATAEWPRLQLPADCAGLFPARGEVVGVRFDATKGEAVWLEIAAERLGFSADPRLVVQRAKSGSPVGTESWIDVVELNDTDGNAGGREFDLGSRDVAGRVAIPETGTYRVLVHNLFRTGPSAGKVPFWLSLRREAPDFRLAVLPQPQPRLNDNDRQVHLWTTSLRRGETRPVRVLASRSAGFEGDIELVATQLPAGVSATPTRIAAGQNAVTMLLTVASNAPAGSGPFELRGTARLGDRELTRTALGGTVVWAVPDWDQERAQSRPASPLWISVCAAESAPIQIQPVAAQPIEAIHGTRLPLTFRIQRGELFPGAFSLKPTGHPEIEKLKEIAVAEKTNQVTLDLNLAEVKLPVGQHTFWLQGVAAGKYRNNPEALAVAEAELKAATDALASASPDAKAAAESRRKSAEERKKAAEERAKPRDLSTAIYSQPVLIQVSAPPAEPKK